jgi:hypothetical protein
LIALSFALWYYVVPPVVGLSKYSVSSSASKTIANSSSLVLYPVNIFNVSQPADDSFNLAINISANEGPISLTIYLRGNSVFSAETNATERTIWCNSVLATSNKTFPGTILKPDVTHSIPVSLLDAFTGGTTPKMVIQNLNTTSATSVSYSYYYTASFRNSDGLPIAMFIVGVIIAIIEGINLLRFAITRIRES